MEYATLTNEKRSQRTPLKVRTVRAPPTSKTITRASTFSPVRQVKETTSIEIDSSSTILPMPVLTSTKPLKLTFRPKEASVIFQLEDISSPVSQRIVSSENLRSGPAGSLI